MSSENPLLSLARFHGTYVAANELNSAKENSSAVNTIFKVLSHPLHPLVTLISHQMSITLVDVAESLYGRHYPDCGLREDTAEKMTNWIMKNRERSVTLLSSTEQQLDKCEQFLRWASGYDPTKATDTLRMLIEDVKLDVRDANRVVKTLNAFHRSIKRINTITAEVFGGYLEEWDKKKQKEIESSYEETLKKRELSAQSSSEEAEASEGYWKSISSSATQMTQIVLRKTANAGTYLYSTASSLTCTSSKFIGMGGIAILGQFVTTTAEKPERDAVKQISKKIMDTIAYTITAIPVQFILNGASFCAYNKIAELAIPQTDENEQESMAKAWMRTALTWVPITMSILYYGQALLAWRKKREESEHIAKIAETALKSDVLNSIFEGVKGKIQDYWGDSNVPIREEDQKEQESLLINYTTQCRQAIQEEFAHIAD